MFKARIFVYMHFHITNFQISNNIDNKAPSFTNPIHNLNILLQIQVSQPNQHFQIKILSIFLIQIKFSSLLPYKNLLKPPIPHFILLKILTLPQIPHNSSLNSNIHFLSNLFSSSSSPYPNKVLNSTFHPKNHQVFLSSSQKNLLIIYLWMY